MNMGLRIEQRLRELAWDQVDLLSKVPELSAGTLSALIRRDSKRSEFAARIADALGVTVGWLVDGKEPKELSDTPPMRDLPAAATARPPVIPEDVWQALPPKARALIEDIMNKSQDGSLDERDLMLLISTTDRLATKS